MKYFLMVPALVLVMSIGAATVAQAKDGGKGGHHPMKCMHEALDKLPAEKAALFKDNMKSLREEGKAKREAIKAKYTELDTLMKAESFDKSAYIAKSDDIQAEHAAMHTKRTANYADAVSKLTLEERRVLADAKAECWKARKDRHKGGDDAASDDADE